MTFMLVVISLGQIAAAQPSPSYDLNVRLTRDGKSLVTVPLTVRAGERRDLDAGPNDFVEVRVTEGSAPERRGIYMEFRVGRKSRDGRRLTWSRPRIRAVENEPATITVGDGGRSTLSLSAIARRHPTLR